MHYLIDGYNLAHWLADDVDMSPAELRATLLGRLRACIPADSESLTVFWDVRNPHPNLPGSESLGWCQVRNVPDADAAIIDTVWASDAPHRMTVVSRDREVTGKSRQLGAKVASPRDLLGR